LKSSENGFAVANITKCVTKFLHRTYTKCLPRCMQSKRTWYFSKIVC